MQDTQIYKTLGRIEEYMKSSHENALALRGDFKGIKENFGHLADRMTIAEQQLIDHEKNLQKLNEETRINSDQRKTIKTLYGVVKFLGVGFIGLFIKTAIEVVNKLL